MKVAALTSGKNVPSSRFRIRQHILPLKEKQIFVKEFSPLNDKYSGPPYGLSRLLDKGGWNSDRVWRKYKKFRRAPSVFFSNFFDVVWLERILVPETLSYELKIKRPFVLDLDDAIWLGEGKGFTPEIVKRASLVFAGNQFLSDWCSQYSKNVHIIPTAVNVQLRKSFRKDENKKTIIGWIGTSSNLKYLESISLELKTILERNKNIEILICSDQSPGLIGFQFEFLKWSNEAEKFFFNKIDIGIMPLEDSEWVKGKCSFKMLQYLGNGIPAIVSGAGMNVQISNELGINVCANSRDEWIEKIGRCITDRNYYNDISVRGRELIDQKYSVQVVSSKIATLLKTLN